MKSWTVKLLCAAAPCLLAGLVVYGAANPPAVAVPVEKPKPDEKAPEQRGSSEAVKQTSITFNDDVTGRPVAIFESIHEPKRYYISPLTHVIPWAHDKKYACRKADGGWQYSFKVVWQHDGLEKQARAALVRHKIHSEAISPMVVSVVRFTPDVSGVSAVELGEIGTRLHLGLTPGVVTFKVPEGSNANFKAQADSEAGLRITAKVYYNAIDLRQASVELSAEDIQKTESFKDAFTKGRQYVNAAQINKIFKDCSRHAQFRDYADDSELAEALSNMSEDFFAKLLSKTGERHIRTIAEAEKLNEDVLKGTGISPKDYQPIVTMYKFLDETKNVNDFKTANQKAREVVKSSGTKAGLNLGVSYGPFSIGLGASKTWGRMDKEMFASQEEYVAFRSEYGRKEGDAPLIVGRGLKLVETATLRNNISLAASRVVLRPLRKAGSITVENATGKDRLEEKTKLVAKKAELEKKLVRINKQLTSLTAQVKQAGTDQRNLLKGIHEVQFPARLLAHGNLNHDGALNNAGHPGKEERDRNMVLDTSKAQVTQTKIDNDVTRLFDSFKGNTSDMTTAEKLLGEFATTQAALDKVRDQLARRLW